jgi:membrane protease YdiL (CAAX protease family)
MAVHVRPGVQSPPEVGAVRGWIRAHPLRAYFVVAFAFAWAVEVVAFALLDVPELPAVVLAGFGPPVAAVVTSYVADGWAGLHVLKRRLFHWRVRVGWYAFAFVVIPVVGFCSFLFLSGGTENVPGSPVVLVASYLLLVLIMMLVGGGQEELGWRGYALGRLQQRFGASRAALLLGVVWGFWHLPLYVLVAGYNNAGSTGTSVAAAFAGFVAYTVALSVVLAWAYNSTSESVFFVMLLHGSMNALFGFAPETSTAAWCLTGAIGALALLVGIATRGRLGCHGPGPQLRAC